MQVKLDEIIGELADVEESLNSEAKDAMLNDYKPEAGTEKMVHAKIVKGRRFNSRTGAEESIPFVQLFSKGEFEVFEKNASNLGYEIIAVLYQPIAAEKK